MAAEEIQKSESSYSSGSPLLDWNYDFNNEVVYIINPLLGEVIMLPQVNQSEDMASAFYGFGFSTHDDHYKVLRVANRRGRRIRGEICTIGVDNKWRSFEDSSLPLYIFSCGINLNGVFYLVGDSVKGSSFILAFDMEEERGHRILLPSEFGDKPRRIVLAATTVVLEPRELRNRDITRWQPPGLKLNLMLRLIGMSDNAGWVFSKIKFWVVRGMEFEQDPSA
ncbi:hypothetical protein RD792_013755 [Penstemon davidsonii]|uniref:F-box associated beta-propeller type 3 domain-containing protein n=1 Tax=Penstemon davidsonii TaxID=160366 RepID=A0ABR0CUV0_9LAMI|nr:hypothetical protein RD792_013755 [Penstemon davidsonii]